MSEPVPRVLAIVVVHDGVTWLPRVLEALGQQDHPALDVVAVDNASVDGSRDLLVGRLGPEAVLLPERDLGFGGAVDLALDAQLDPPDLVLLVHDDLVLAPDAVSQLVDALRRDPSLAAVGPKLRWLDEGRRLQSVGFSVDLTGRVDHGLDGDEIDHGQRDGAHDVLAVSSAGMLLRHDDYRGVGGFDRRYHVFRDDLDLCWRLWLVGRRVGVEPRAVAAHARAASDFRRLGQARLLGPRYFAERNTLATLLKVRSAARLPGVVALYLLLGLGRLVGFVVTRRFSEAWQTGRAWAWNVLHLRETLRLRRLVQRSRERDDRQLLPLMVRLAPRLRSYLEAVADFLTGGSEVGPAIELVESEDLDDDGVLRRLTAVVRRRPLTVAGLAVVLTTLVGSLPLWRGGRLRGGELLPWPERTADFVSPYLSAWHDVPGLATDVAPSPAPIVLALVDVLAFGSDWLAPRLLLLLAVPLAWVFAVRALRELTPHPGGRALGATVYALSPPLLAALAEGRLGAVVVAVLLPAAAAGLVVATRPQRSPGAWRGTAAVVLVGVAMLAFEPVLVLVVPLAAILGLVLVLVRGRGHRRRPALARFALIAVAAPLLALPWLPTVASRFGDLVAAEVPHDLGGASGLDLLLLAPDGAAWVGPVPGATLVVAALVGVALAGRRRPVVCLALWLAAAAAAVAATVMAEDAGGPWPGVALLFTALALSGVVAVGLSEAGARLAEHPFGWRQVGSLGALGGLLAGVAAGVVATIGGGWSGWTTDPVAVPAFVTAEREQVGAFDVLVLADTEDLLRWSFTGPAGPDLSARGYLADEVTLEMRRDVVEAVVGRSDPGAGTRLGDMGVRYVLVPEEGVSPELAAALGVQLDLEPRAVVEGLLLEVAPWRPEARVVPQDGVARVGDVPVAARAAEVRALTSLPRPGTWELEDAPAGLVTVAAAPSPAWLVLGDGAVLEPAAGTPLASFVLPDDAELLQVRFARQAQRSAAVGVQVVVLLVLVSLLLRPPAFAMVGARAPEPSEPVAPS